MTTSYSNVKTHYYVPPNNNSTVTDLALASTPIINKINLTWSHPPTQGTYYIYFLVNGDWVYSGTNVTATSVSLTNVSAVKAQIRTNDLYPSNEIDLPRVRTPSTRTLTTTPRYDGVRLDISPSLEAGETMQIYKDNVFLANVADNTYLSTTGGTFKVRVFKGSGSDILYGSWSNNSTDNKLSPPPARVEPSAPAEFFLGNTRAGEPVLHICSPSVVPSSPSVESGKVAVDWAQDYVGVLHDYGEDTYFHSEFKYIHVIGYYRYTSYTTTGYGRRFSVDDFGNNLIIVAFVNNAGEISTGSGNLRRVWDNLNNYNFLGNGEWDFGSSGIYNGQTEIYCSSSIVEIRVYKLNLVVSGRSLAYQDVAGTDNGIIVDPTKLEVGGVDFGNNVMLAACGPTAKGEYVNSMNLNDDIIPFGCRVDSLGIADGPGIALQALGTAGGTGWDIEMNTGTIKRGGNIWFNAGRGRTRLKYLGYDDTIITDSKQITIPDHGGTPHNQFEVAFGTEQIGSFAIHSSLKDAVALAFTVTPSSYIADDVQFGHTFSTDTTASLFMGTERVLIFADERDVLINRTTTASGEPWWETAYFLRSNVYLKKVSDIFFILEVQYTITTEMGSAGEGLTYSIPGFSFSFLGIG